MNKFYLALLTMTGLSLLFYFGGLVESNPLINYILNIQDLSASDIWSLIVLGALTSTAAIIVGIATRNIELAAMTVITPVILSLLWNFIDVFNVVYAFNSVLAVLLFGPPLFAFIFITLDWWRGLS